MKKWIIAVIVNVFLICVGAEDGMCCNKMKYLIQKKKRAFAIVCAPGNTALRRCCNNIKKGVMSLENAYRELCKKKSVAINLRYKECRQYKMLNESNRNVKYRSGRKCDRSLTKGWYRFGGGAGTEMPKSCVAKNRCGTHASGWLNGTHPTMAEGEVTRKVCYHWKNSCCHWSNDIEVINCGPYFVYKLSRPRVCSLRYCGTN
ncbi:pancreatic secretory granule membrane major glycoprotein GP2-like [Xenia sp. Carnegie-2017]|uniref:pancreatic secretory granule membrane major glycoprotein GP2-like n=1 Tax=Xenia sp. Carnegie-2017 TaxID=2897299 RepID=UPI001F04B943|nr:pancreatic secretory granule membrane major glycoprotein GP2-like [Xenia sp. Carnegie-2017]